ncbi:unnamed protein product [Blepharisma stoltei]|uniref:Uncharacterized protein n=1 Tax=Blepharisma stoltei TaxID=1481888 RepID=A0AAU9JQV2_9CILI|nr:unnamed protein product [Blepharisma stoltei]
MKAEQCFNAGCLLEIEYICQCTSPETYSCKLHWIEHCDSSDRDHTFKSAFLKPPEGTKEAVLQFLTKEQSKKNKLKNKIIDSFRKNITNSKNSFEESLKKLDFDSEEISNWMEKVLKTQKISKQEQEPILKLLALNPEDAIIKAKTLLSSSSESYGKIKLLYGLNEEIEKKIDSFIKEKFENFLDSRLVEIEKTLLVHEEILKSCTNQQEKVNNSISVLISELEKDKRKFEDWNKEVKIVWENQVNMLNSQLSCMTENINKKLNETIQSQNQFNLNVENKLLIPQELRVKTFAILGQKNDPSTEADFRRTCSKYENELRDTLSSDLFLNHNYQNYISSYILNTSLYLLKNFNNTTNLSIYNTESETENIKTLDIPEPLDIYTCIAQLPKGGLFCFGKNPPSGITLIIDKKYNIRMLPSGVSCYCSSAIYLDRNIYCFGGIDNNGYLNLSEKFDLDRECWIKLSPMLQSDYGCHSVVFDRDILVSGKKNKYLLRYSIDGNVFNRISFEFAENKRKILVNGERIYLIECGGFIYESEIQNIGTWKQVAESKIRDSSPSQVYYSYNKEAIYVGCKNDEGYYKFNLNNKIMIQL